MASPARLGTSQVLYCSTLPLQRRPNASRFSHPPSLSMSAPLRLVLYFTLIFHTEISLYTMPHPSQILKPNPSMQLRYWSMVVLQSAAGSAALEKSMHSSRLDFSSLHMQQGFGFAAAGFASVLEPNQDPNIVAGSFEVPGITNCDCRKSRGNSWICNK